VTHDLSRPGLEQRLAAHAPRAKTLEKTLLTPRRAAVAAVLRWEAAGPEVLLMKRAEVRGDRWSGQVSLPGGREEEHDPDLRTTAVRETGEELGLDLTCGASFLGQLDAVRAIAKGKVLPMSITPFVFALDEPLGLDALRLNHEAQAAFWLPLERVASGELDGEVPYKMGPTSLRLACWHWEGYTVWGLTHSMLSGLLALLRR
jgi:8-oxo-dGTP pyrophosphatase MutT (NUDIX family)